MWQIYALLAALFAALTAIFAKIGVSQINSNLATAIRTSVILLLTWIIALCTTNISQLKDISKHYLIFLVLSGLATGASWLFYFKALELGDVSNVAPVDKLSVAFTILIAFLFFGKPLTLKTVMGASFMVTGSLILLYP